MHWLYAPFVLDDAHIPFRITEHARQRFIERTSMPFRAIEAFVSEALLHGNSINNCQAALTTFLYEKSARGKWPVVYKGLMLLFSSDEDGMLALVTLYSLPDHLVPSERKARRFLSVA